MKMNKTIVYVLAMCVMQIPFLTYAFAKKYISDCEFAIVIPSFNNANYYEENLNSACWQNSTNPYHIYYINDCSTDGTGELVENFVKNNGLEEKVTIIHNTKNVGPGANTYNTIHNYIEDHVIVAILDGDDLFPHNNVLMTLERYYKDPNIWMTYGVLETFPEQGFMGADIPEHLIKQNLIRKEVWVTALRTFKAGLFKKIKREYFDYKGEFMKVTADLAFMLAMLEMSIPKYGNGIKHCAFVHEVLYKYRINSPINDFRIRPKLQKEVDDYVRSLKPYKPLKNLQAEAEIE